MANLKASPAVINLFTDTVKPAYFDTDSNVVEVDTSITVPVKITAFKNADYDGLPENALMIVFDLNDLCESVAKASGKDLKIVFDEYITPNSIIVSLNESDNPW